MLETLASHLESIAALAPHWGYALVFFFMAVESSFIPFPSEVVMLPAGFLAFRGELTLHSPWPDAALALLFGTLGSFAGACVNYWLGLKLGRPFLYRYGKWFFLKPATLERAEELFRRYGDITTFVCRLITVIRQLISIPAGFARMPFGRFAFFTVLGAGIWNLILLAVGAWLGHETQEMSYLELVTKGKALVTDHYGWILAGLALVVAVYALCHRLAVGGRGSLPAGTAGATADPEPVAAAVPAATGRTEPVAAAVPAATGRTEPVAAAAPVATGRTEPVAAAVPAATTSEETST